MKNNFFSQAGNFFSGVQTGVDPRTGQFYLNLPLVNINSNYFLGPELNLSLTYSPLSADNYGFGTGFSLGITQFSHLTHLLELSNGEKYQVAPGSDIVRNQKLSNFRFAYTNGSDDADGYTVFWKEGKKEQLSPTGNGDLFVTTGITSPSGHQLSLSWEWSGQFAQLMTVTDEHTTLCRLSYWNSPEMTVWPGSTEEYTIRFELINDDQLASVSRYISPHETLHWYFEYDRIDGVQHLLLTGINWPTGMTDKVEYSQIQGLQFPNQSGLTRMPAVLSHRRNPGAGQLETLTWYDYTVQNFLGYDGNFGDWDADSDYLYTTLTDYTYGSTETVSNGEDSVTIIRTYNNYHLQISEETTRKNTLYRTEMTYYAREWTFIDAQPAQFQLLREKKEIWTDSKQHYRAQTTHTEFDESGNPIRQVDPDGTVTTTSWYPFAGDKGCPPEPNGFVRFIKEHTITPRKTAYDTPVISTHYTYARLGDSACVVQDNCLSYADGILQQQKHTAYHHQPGSAEFGRIITQTATMYKNDDPTATFISRQDFTTVVTNNLMTQTVLFTGHDNIQTTFRRVQSALTCLLLGETDAQGVATTYTYDLLGRPLTRTVAPATRYENTTVWTYSIDQNGPVSIQIDSSGNQHKNHFDGAGRIIKQLRLDKDHTRQWYEISTSTYGVLDNVTASSCTDWLTGATDGSARYAVSVDSSWDGWGNRDTESFSDGTKNLQYTDPVALTKTVYMQGNTPTEKLITGKHLTLLDSQSLLPVIDRQLDVSGAEQGTRQHAWDGLGRLRQETDELNNMTLRTYDAQGRVLTQTLPDGSVVSRSYAPHLTGENVASIRVTGPDVNGKTQSWLLGTQTFDSLGRVTKRISGGRTTVYTYNGASPEPAAVTLPSGKTVQYSYIPELGNAVSRMTADDVTQTFSYDDVSGDLMLAQEGKTVTGNTWLPSGELKEESFSQNGGTRKTEYSYTLAGEPAIYTDITGKQTHYSRDQHGRVIALDDEALTVRLNYDALGRLSKQTVTDNATAATLSTTLKYDDFGREITRIIADSNGVTVSVAQVWTKNDLLASRTTRQSSDAARVEQYHYDSRNRLVGYNVTGSHLPPDAYGHSLSAQSYQYDALNNVISVTTTLADGTTDVARYAYENSDDPTQLTSVTHTHRGYPSPIPLRYDACGRMIHDEAGRTLRYDAIGRLSHVNSPEVTGGSYGYDALNRLVRQTVNNQDNREIYYRGDERVNEVLTAQNRDIRLIKNGHTCLGVGEGNDLTLTASDHHDSLLWSREARNSQGQFHIWSPYGNSNGDASDLLPGFNGEFADPISGTYHLGNGFRAYNPVLMRFNCPDNLSPFGAGGINPYAYCAGDPINNIDPSGHMSWQSIVGIVASSIGLALAAFTAGSSIAAAGGIMAALSAASTTSLVAGGLGVVADVTAIASAAAEETNPEASSILGWVSMATGLVGMATSVGQGVRGMTQSRGSYNVARENNGILSEAGALFGSKQRVPVSVNSLTPMDVQVSTQGSERWFRGYSDNFLGSGQDAILLHGTKDAKLVMGTTVDSVNDVLVTNTSGRQFYSAKELAQVMKNDLNINLYKGSGREGPVHLLSCYAKRGAAQNLANELQRPVIGYSKHSTVTPSLLALEHKAFQVSAKYRQHDFRRLFKEYHIAEPRTFYPQPLIDLL